ncbi:MAG TPA: rod shape-determining protein, partial [Clostridia bacterium]|nr:rod shape-determining protein [Clostridia bacterium]
MDKICLSVDIGSKNIVIANKESQVILNEPSVVATANVNSKYSYVACGAEAAKSMQNIEPIKNGSICNVEAFVFMMKSFINRLAPRKFLKNYTSVNVSVSCGLTNIEKRVIEDAFYKAGVTEVVIIESPLSVKAINSDKAMFLINIGADNTEIALVSDDGIINGCSIDVGGSDIDEAIFDYVGDKYRLVVNQLYCEDIKLGLASLEPNNLSTIVIKGDKVTSSTPNEVKLTATELKPLVQGVINKIIEVAASIMMMIPKSYQYIV